mgnify:CR=1 FL=1
MRNTSFKAILSIFSSLHLKYINFKYDTWKYNSFINCDFIYIDIANLIYKIHPKLIKNDMIDIENPIERNELISLLNVDCKSNILLLTLLIV